MQPVIRTATTDDIETLVQLRLDFLHGFRGAPPESVVERMRHSIRDYLRRTIPGGECHNLLTEVEGEVAATGSIVFYELMPGYRMPAGRKGYIMNIYTKPEYRRRGLAGAIVKGLLDEARRRGVDAVHLHATAQGEPVYRALDFSATEEPELKLYLR